MYFFGAVITNGIVFCPKERKSCHSEAAASWLSELFFLRKKQFFENNHHFMLKSPKK